MKVLVISDVSSYMVGGVPAETRCLLNGLMDRGHEVLLVADAPMARCERASHRSIRLPVDDSLAIVTAAAIASFRPDVVHVICMSSSGVFRLAPLLKQRPAVLTIHSVPPCERKLAMLHGSEFLHYLVRSCRFLANSLAWRAFLTLRSIPHVIVHSKFVADIVVRKGFPRARVSEIALPFDMHGEDVASTEIGPDPLLVTVGGIAHTKGQHDVVLALPALSKQFPTIRYQIIGEIRDESYITYLKNLGDKLGVSGRVQLTPGLTDKEKNAALDAAAVYVQPSHEEGFCLAFIEAAMRVPRLVGADAGAIAAISQEDPGARVVRPRHPKALAAAIAALLSTQLPLHHMSSRRGRLARRFSVDTYVHAHEVLYRKIVAGCVSRQ